MTNFGARALTPLVLVALLGCPDDPREDEAPTVVAEVAPEGADAWTLSRSAFAAELARSGVARIKEDKVRLAVARRIADRLVDEQLLLFAAKRAGVSVTDKDISREVEHAMEGYPPGVFQRMLHGERMTVLDYRAAVERRLSIDRFTRDELNKLPPIDEAQAQTRYRAELAGKKNAPEVRVRQVLVATKEEANFIRGEIVGKRLSAEAAARRFSAAPDGAQGGDLGWFKSGDMPPAFDVCFTMKRGELSPVVKSAWGFHIFEVLDTRPERKMSFVEAEERLYDELRRERQSAGRTELLARLRKVAKVVVHEPAIASAASALGPPPEDEQVPSFEADMPVKVPAQPTDEPAPKLSTP